MEALLDMYHGRLVECSFHFQAVKLRYGKKLLRKLIIEDERGASLVDFIPGCFLSEGGVISCEITGPRQYGRGLEVPCIYKLSGEEALVNKAKEKLLKIKTI